MVRGYTCEPGTCVCGCVPLDPPCEHLKAYLKRPHSLPIEQWAELLERWKPFPRDDRDDIWYAEPHPCSEPDLSLAPHAIVMTYEMRMGLHLSLWHKGDWWRDQGLGEAMRLGPVARNCGNGALDPRATSIPLTKLQIEKDERDALVKARQSLLQRAEEEAEAEMREAMAAAADWKWGEYEETLKNRVEAIAAKRRPS